MINRREFILGSTIVGGLTVTGASLPEPKPSPKSSGIPGTRFLDIDKMCGAQLAPQLGPNIAYAMRSKYNSVYKDLIENDVIITDNAIVLANPQGSLIEDRWVSPMMMRGILNGKEHEMALAMYSQHVIRFSEGKHDLGYWRIAIARKLNELAQKHRMDDPRVRPWGRSCNRVFEDYKHTEYSAPFIFQRRREQIARITRRGCGNVIVGCEEGIAALKMGSDQGQRFLNGLSIVKFNTGEVVPEPFALLGYNGSNKYDAGLIFVHDMWGYGALLPHQTDVYWTKIW